MQSHYPSEFERDMGCTAAEWLGWLPGAVRGRAITLGAAGPDTARVQLDEQPDSALWLQWQPQPPRRIALITLPRLAVRFRFEQVGSEARHAFMRYFDLYTQRGGG